MPVISVAYVFPDDPDDDMVQDTGRVLIADQARRRGIEPKGLTVRRTYDERHVVAWVDEDQFPTNVPEKLLAAMRIVVPPGSAHVRIVRWRAVVPGGTPPEGIDLRDVRQRAASPIHEPPPGWPPEGRSGDYT